MNLEKHKIAVMLRKRLQEIQRYKNIEVLQEERLKNMFEHLRQLDLEIKDFLEDDEIINAQNNFNMPEKQMLEQIKSREKNHHNMKLLEYDLSNIHVQVQRDFDLVHEQNDIDISGLTEPKYMSEQLKSSMHDQIDNLQSKIYDVLKLNHKNCVD